MMSRTGLVGPGARTLYRHLPLTAALAALITLAAKVQVPFWPVPMTMHTLAVMTIALLAGPRVAVGAMAAYLAAGAAGLPVFSGSPARGIGIAYMAGPTGGYLLGYLLAAGLVGWLALGGGTLRRVLAMLAGLAVIYAVGAAWLSAFVPADKVLAVGVLPFLLGDLLKIGVAALLAALWTRMRGKGRA
ncbi:biotin transporter BioY [Paracoccus sp. EF6]|uniref:Biotin transporter n=2 Tax=Paracoccus benzoatiresistens TaxID=2997341 RepID=A0ABT4J8A0_9RHOB|nr:biotin transporter BioY [Paracoccus sp. EF6]MCZ0962651.1 biotin transporter BioY [Paracoccus sp. EF6]